jgi:hypothetical protein
LEDFFPKKMKVPVHHVHGVISDSTHGQYTGEEIVLSMEEYFHNMAKPFSWQTTVQLNALIGGTCLFVGTSLTDINMLRMLTYARDEKKAGRVFALLAREEYYRGVEREMKKLPPSVETLGEKKGKEWIKEAVNFTARAKASLLQDLGVEMIMVKSFLDLSLWIGDLARVLIDSKGGNYGDRYIHK